MITRIRQFGRNEFHNIEHDPDDCPFCAAGRKTKWNGQPGVIFLVAEARVGFAQKVQRVECVRMIFGFGVMKCEEVTREQALTELAQWLKERRT